MRPRRVNVGVAALIVAVDVGAVAGQAAAALPGLDVLADLAPLFGAIGVAGALWGLLVRRLPLAAAALPAILASGAVIVPEFTRHTGPEAAADAPGTLKVVQINQLRSNADVGRVADWLIAQDPDIVTITEARHDLRDLLVRRAGWRTAGAAGDLMILTPERYVRMTRPRADGAPTFVNATYSSGSGPLEVFTTHVDRNIAPGARPLAQLGRLIATHPHERMILTGDFNATPWSSRLRAFDRSLALIRRDRAVPTWPAQVMGLPWPLPFAPIDHVYAGSGWATVKVERGPWVGSDHYPLVVTLAPAGRP